MQHDDMGGMAGFDWQAARCEAAEQEVRRLNAELAELRKDAERLNWLRDNLFEHEWNGVVGPGCAVQWRVAPDFRFAQRNLSDTSGIMAGDFRRAVDTAMDTTPRTLDAA